MQNIIYQEDQEHLLIEKVKVLALLGMTTFFYLLAIYNGMINWSGDIVYMGIASIVFLPFLIMAFLAYLSISRLIVSDQGFFPPIRSNISVIFNTRDFIYFKDIESIYLNTNKNLTFISILFKNGKARSIGRKYIKDMEKFLKIIDSNNINIIPDRTYIPNVGEY